MRVSDEAVHGPRARRLSGTPVADAEIRPRRTHLSTHIRQMLVGVLLIDAGALTLASMFAWLQRGLIDGLWQLAPHPYPWSPLQGPALIVFWLVMIAAFGGYRERTYGVGVDEFRSITVASAVTLATFTFVSFLVPHQESRGYPLLFFAFGLPVLLVARYVDRKALHRARNNGRLLKRVVAVGSVQAVTELTEVLGRSPWLGYEVTAMCTPDGRGGERAAVPVLGGVDDVRQVAIDLDADAVLVAGGSYSSAADLRRLGWALEGLDLEMLVVPSLTDIAGPRVHLSHVAGLPLVHVDEPQVGAAGGWTKRLFDVVATSLGLLVVGLPMLLVALLVKLGDGGPVFYRQERVGLHGRRFHMIKFRSMVPDADRLRPELEISNEHDGVLFKIREDPRITRVGRFIRRYSLDELPQLLNVLRGEMSLVGPRPPLPSEVDKYDQDVHRRLLVRPGLTGLWQVSGRSDLSWSESVRLDLYYVDNWSLVQDLVILLKTLKAVIRSAGAY